MYPLRMYRFLLLGLAVFATGGAAQAAPQILGLVATGPEPTVLHCRDGVCSARFTTFCLQQNRDAPLLGTQYSAADSAALRLVVTGADGTQRSVQAEDVSIQSVHNYTTVKISVPEKQVRALGGGGGGVTAALSVAPRAALLPKAVAGDPQPQTEEEIALATGAHRAVGEDHVDRGGGTAEAAGTIMSMINALHNRGSADGPKDAQADARQAHAILQQSRTSGPDREMLSERVNLCSQLTASAWYRDGMPTCLENFHDSYVSTLTGRYWDAVGTGY